MVTLCKITTSIVAALVIIATTGTLLYFFVFKDNGDIEMTSKHVRPIWGYSCQSTVCKKIELTDENLATTQSFDACRLTCANDLGTLWPKPTGTFIFSKRTSAFDPKKVYFQTNLKDEDTYWKEAEARFIKQLNNKMPKNYYLNNGGRSVFIGVSVESDEMKLTLETRENYKIIVSSDDNELKIQINATNYFGARHGLETLAQLIVHEDIRNELHMIVSAEITDEPVFKYRGTHLDTARNYFEVSTIKRTIDAMAMVKMNSFHWHITDSHSFPLVIESQPELHTLGAYSPEQVYTHEDVKEIVHYAKVRGIRVIPEFDAPAHVGEGWQQKGLTLCFKMQPWQNFCDEPPCGQLDPTKDEVYNVMEDIFREMQEIFDYPDMFHMGGDEVKLNCWNTSTAVQDWMLAKDWQLENDDFMRLWGHFQERALERLDKVVKEKIPIILWNSHLTEEPALTQYLDKDRYIIQIWMKAADSKIQTLLANGYKLIITNVDALYLDCGFPGWVAGEHNWCAPYIGWQKIYDNKMEDIAAGNYINQIYGASTALWTEQADDSAIDSRLWPRVSALAERMWSNPANGWRAAESRMLINRKRLVENGIQADRLQPQWCLVNEEECPLKD